MTTFEAAAEPQQTTGRPGRLEPLIELERLVVAVRLRRRACLIGGVVGVLLGLALPHVRGGPAASAAVLLSRGDRVGPLDAYADKAAVLQAEGAAVQAGLMPSTGVALCASSAVAGPAAATLGISPTAMLADYSCADAAPNIIRITVRGSSAAQAKQAAAAVSESFLAAYRAQGSTDADAQYQDLLGQRGQLEDQLAEVTKSLAASTYPAQVAALTDQQKGLLTRIDDLTARASDVQTVATTAAAGSRIVDPPLAVPKHGRLLFPIAGGILGVGAAMAWAILAVIVRDRPLRRREIAQALGEPIALDLRRTRQGRHFPHDLSAAAPVLARLIRTGRQVIVLDSGCPELAPRLAAAAAQQLGTGPADPRVVVGSLRPAGAWAQPAPGDRVAVLLVRAGHESAAALREGVEDLRTAGIPVAAVFLVDPDRHDRTDGFAVEAYARLSELQRGART